MRSWAAVACAVLLLGPPLRAGSAPDAPALLAGAAKADVTPETPIRLCGYAARASEATEVAQPLFARALAFGASKESAVVVVCIDAILVPAAIGDEIARRVERATQLPRERIALCATHNHCAPCLAGGLGNLFVPPPPAAEVERVETYTEKLVANTAAAAIEAVGSMRPATLSFLRGTCGFAANRRTPGGPTDHEVPLLAVRDEKGGLVATLAAYACHCTTLGPEFNKTCGEWAGAASEAIEAAHPGAVALIAIGCGADANPAARGRLEDATAQGAALAAEIERLLTDAGNATPVDAPPLAKLERIDLPFGTPRTREDWEKRKAQGGHAAIHAEHFLALLDAGKPVPDVLPYAVQSIRCGEQLAMVFLAGEVVVDYASRLKRELRAERLFLAAYSNDCPCYVPSRRILDEGGYEAEGAMTYYLQPTRLAPACEDLIVRAVRAQLPDTYLSQASLDEFPPPLSPARARDALVAADGLRIELAAAEPLIESPVAIDFAPDGALFVVEMRDYPSGMRGGLEPGGRVKRLTDEDSDGAYDRATVFLDALPFPTGCLTLGGGLIVCAAPDILFAKDADGDGIAEHREVLFTGFATENEQARVNSPILGLDGWIHCAIGLIGGAIESKKTGEKLDLRGRNFRFKPDTGELEAESGVSQQGLARDDYGDRFGCDSGNLAFHFPLDEREVERNPWVAPPPANVAIAADRDGDPRRLFPLSRTLERFNDPDNANRVTSACGIEIYRDDVLGAAYRDNVFTCEPVHNLVTRRVLELDGFTWRAVRAPEDSGEAGREFLASRDNWFRPVQAKAGPDGALYVVDMARFLIEHPRWVSAERLARIDIRAGEHLGRIWRVVKDGAPRRTMPDLTALDDRALAAALDSPSGALRDLVARELRFRGTIDATQIARIAAEGAPPGARADALAILARTTGLRGETLHRAILDPEPVVRAVACRFAGDAIAAKDERARTLLAQCAEVDRHPRIVRETLRAIESWPGGMNAVMRRPSGNLPIAIGAEDGYGRASLLALAATQPFAPAIASWDRAPDEVKADFTALACGLVDTAAGRRDVNEVRQLLDVTLLPMAATGDAGVLAAIVRAVVALDELGIDSLEPEHPSDAGEERAARLQFLFGGLRARAASPETPAAVRAAACTLLGREPSRMSEDLALLSSLLGSGADPEVEDAAIDALGRLCRGESEAAASNALLNTLIRLGPERSERALDALIARDVGCRALLDAVALRRIEPSRIDAARRQRLLDHTDAAIAARAAAVLGRPDGAKATLAALAPVATLRGDRTRGAAHFDRACATCHAFRGRGSEIGADLAGLTDRTTSGLLAAIADPNAAVDARYQAYELKTKDGRTLSGIVESESATAVALKMQSGMHESVLRTDLASLRATGRSLMPEGLLLGFTHQDVADLIAYLQTAPRALDSIPADEAAEARRRVEAEGLDGCSAILAGALHPAQASWIGVLPLRYCRQTDGRSRVAWRTAPVPATLRDGARVRFRVAAAMGWNSMPGSGFTLAINGREALRFDVKIDDATFSRPDGEVSLAWYVHARNGEDATGVLTLEVASSWLKKDEGALIEVNGDAAGSQRWFGVLDLAAR